MAMPLIEETRYYGGSSRIMLKKADKTKPYEAIIEPAN